MEQIAEMFLDPASDAVPSVIVADLRMPRLNGLAALSALRRVDRSIPFLLITAFGDLEVHEEARRLRGAMLDKPFSMGDFCDLIARLV